MSWKRRFFRDQIHGLADLANSVTTGPIFRESDPVYEGVKVPVAFYKVVGGSSNVVGIGGTFWPRFRKTQGFRRYWRRSQCLSLFWRGASTPAFEGSQGSRALGSLILDGRCQMGSVRIRRASTACVQPVSCDFPRPECSAPSAQPQIERVVGERRDRISGSQ
jgi:hypothetical protein